MSRYAIDHVQIAIPPNGETAGRAFFGGLLGLREIDKPADMTGRGGCWFELGGQQLHLGVEVEFRPAKKAHVALATDELQALQDRLEAAGYEISNDVAVAGRERFFTADPFGNRIEFIAVETR